MSRFFLRFRRRLCGDGVSLAGLLVLSAVLSFWRRCLIRLICLLSFFLGDTKWWLDFFLASSLGDAGDPGELLLADCRRCLLDKSLLFAPLVGKSGVKLTVRSAEALLLRRPRASGGCNLEVCSTAVTTPSLKGASRIEKEGAPGVRRGLGSSLVTKLLATLSLSRSTSCSATASGTNISTLVRDLKWNSACLSYSSTCQILVALSNLIRVLEIVNGCAVQL